MKYPLSKIAVLLLCLVSAFMMQAASVHLSVSMPRGQRTIGVGELFYISYEISNSDARPATPASVPGAKVLYFERTGQSSAYTNINGVTSQVRSMTYTLTAKAQKEGSYTFGPVTVGGMKSNAVSYTIGKSSYKNVRTERLSTISIFISGLFQAEVHRQRRRQSFPSCIRI